ncbi:hypothetical protein B0H19DRAFT_1181749 [Mycena capillaripes]|nr:hypothetical protein B0H19DRAFT_1181749 [Mycena capillaripes]
MKFSVAFFALATLAAAFPPSLPDIEATTTIIISGQMSTRAQGTVPWENVLEPVPEGRDSKDSGSTKISDVIDTKNDD